MSESWSNNCGGKTNSATNTAFVIIQMNFTPNHTVEHLKESLAGYLESQYRISHPLVFNERADLLRKTRVIAQLSFIEATPAFETEDFLQDLEGRHPDKIPSGLTELVDHGIPISRFRLYTHQQRALLANSSDRPNLLVATGTGSGKTEAFLLPILARILSEAKGWQAPTDRTPVTPSYHETYGWLHSRRNERRPAVLLDTTHTSQLAFAPNFIRGLLNEHDY